MKKQSAHHTPRTLFRLAALLLILCLLPTAAPAETAADETPTAAEASAAAETTAAAEATATAETPDGWVTFLLICNEGMNNSKGNAGNTLMVVAIQPDEGKIRLMMFTWDTFIEYEGYDVPQKLDMPYRNNGPEEAVKVFNANFGLNIQHFMSLNYLNLAALIDEYGGVTVDVTRAERNALNGMVASKKIRLQEEVAGGMMSQTIVDMLAQDYYLNDFGPDTRLNGLQAVGFGWLQYDSVYNCCERDAEVIASLFHSVSAFISEHIVFYTDESGEPEHTEGRRTINLDHITDDDYDYIHSLIVPFFQMSSHDLGEEEIRAITISLAHIAYRANLEGVDILDYLRYTVLPIEATQPYDMVAGTKGHLVDKEANIAFMQEFLYGDN